MPKTAKLELVFKWLIDGIFTVHADGHVYKGTKLLAQRINPRKGMDGGDPRVDLCHESKRRSCHVSQLVWMVFAGVIIPSDFEIHHRDEDSLNNHFDNLLCVHKIDHLKLHDKKNVPF